MICVLNFETENPGKSRTNAIVAAACVQKMNSCLWAQHLVLVVDDGHDLRNGLVEAVLFLLRPLGAAKSARSAGAAVLVGAAALANAAAGAAAAEAVRVAAGHSC